MNNSDLENAQQTKRNQMIEYIICAIQQLDDDKLQNIYHLIVHIR